MPIRRFILYAQKQRSGLPPQKGVILKEWEAEIMAGEGVGVRLNVGVFFSPLFLLSTFQCPPPRNVGMNTACHPLGGWGSTAVIKKINAHVQQEMDPVRI